MEIVQLIQGSPEWHAHRAKHFNASDAPAMMGVSPYKTRSQLIKELATGITEEIDAATQKRFDDGHRFEALARPLAEEIIGETLYPVTGVLEGTKFSASFDGLTMLEDAALEHKSLNDEIRACQSAADLPLLYRIQMEQQLMVSNANRNLFMATKWDDNDTLIEKREFWYEADLELRAQIVAGWKQLEADVAAYVPQEVIPAAVAEPTLALPVPAITVGGELTIHSNIDVFGEALERYITGIPEKPDNDQDFANCKAAISKLKDAETAIDGEVTRALTQITAFDEMQRKAKFYFDLSRTKRLATEKLVEAREKSIKEEEVQKGKDALAAHIETLNTRIGQALMPVVPADFAQAIKNKRTISSLRESVGNELTRAKIAASEIADRIQINLNTIQAVGDGYAHLFNDTSTIVLKDKDDLAMLITVRKTQEDARVTKIKADAEEAERERIRAEEEAKAAAKVKEEQEKAEQAERDRLASKISSEIKAQEQPAETEPVVSAPSLNEVLDAVAPSAVAQAMKVSTAPGPWQVVRDRVGTELDRLSVTQLELVAEYIAKNFPVKAAA